MRIICAAALLAVAQTAAQAQALWWDGTYKARRQVTVYAPEWNLPGDDAAIVTFHTGGHMKADGSDVRVVVRGKEVSCRFYGAGPGDTATVAFRVERGVRDYYVYFGNAGAAAPRYDWQPRRGLILETRGYKGGDPKNLAAMREIWSQSEPFYGADAVDKVWHGQNMFGPSESFVSLYTGWLMCPSPGDYVFATTSDDASFLLVDGKPVVAWPGYHGPVADARHSGIIRLKAGLREFQYLHLNAGGTTCAVAAWRPPGAEVVEVIPESAFAPLSRAVVGPLELAGERIAADFSPEITGEALLSGTEEIYAVQITFTNTTARDASSLVYWDFGDGQNGSGRSATHIYLASGVYPVTMRIGRTNDAPAVTHRINVHEHWGWQTRKEIDEISAYFPAISRYNLETLDAASAANLLRLAEEQGSIDFMTRAALSIVSRQDAPREQLEFATGRLRESLGAARLASDARFESAYAKAFGGAKGERKAVLALALADIQLEKGRPGESQAVLKQALGEDMDDPLRRRLLIACGDAARYLGDRDGAHNAFDAAARIPLRRSGIQQAALGGAIAFKTEDYLARKQYADAEKALDAWDWEKPLEKLDGYSSFLRARLLEAQDRPSRALSELEAIAAVSADSAYAPKALLLAGKIHSSRGNRESAKAAFDRILKAYRTSPEAEEAGRMLPGRGR